MITVFTKNCKKISQKIYDDIIGSLPAVSLTCPCGCSGCLTEHGSYNRHVKEPEGKILLTVRRVLRTVCGATHALLLSSVVPYSQVPLRDHAAIAEAHETDGNPADVMDGNPELSPGQVFYILSLYLRYRRERLKAEHIPLSSLHALTDGCFAAYSRPFMQIKKTVNILFVPPT